jgi:hypothetical protein
MTSHKKRFIDELLPILIKKIDFIIKKEEEEM